MKKLLGRVSLPFSHGQQMVGLTGERNELDGVEMEKGVHEEGTGSFIRVSLDGMKFLYPFPPILEDLF